MRSYLYFFCHHANVYDLMTILRPQMISENWHWENLVLHRYEFVEDFMTDDDSPIVDTRSVRSVIQTEGPSITEIDIDHFINEMEKFAKSNHSPTCYDLSDEVISVQDDLNSVFKLDECKIRCVTLDSAKYISCLDLIAAVTQTINPSQSWSVLCNGRGQRDTPVIDVLKSIELINLLTGPTAFTSVTSYKIIVAFPPDFPNKTSTFFADGSSC